MRRNRERSRDQRDTDTRFSGGRGRVARRSAIAGVEVGQPRDGRAVGGARWCNGSRAVIRRNSDGVWGTEIRNGGAGCGRAAQEAFCGAVGVVALVQPSGRATRTDRGAGARLDVFGERRARRAGRATDAPAADASAGRGSASLD